MRFATDESPKGRDAVIMQLSKTLVEKRERRDLYGAPRTEDGFGTVGLSHEPSDPAEGKARLDVIGSFENVQQVRLFVAGCFDCCSENLAFTPKRGIECATNIEPTSDPHPGGTLRLFDPGLCIYSTRLIG